MLPVDLQQFNSLAAQNDRLRAGDKLGTRLPTRNRGDFLIITSQRSPQTVILLGPNRGLEGGDIGFSTPNLGWFYRQGDGIPMGLSSIRDKRTTVGEYRNANNLDSRTRRIIRLY